MSSISLRIGGNKLANEGFRVLVNIGTPSPDVKDRSVEPGLIENDYYFFIRHEADQIVYTVQKTRIRSYGAARDGRLLMAIGIPKGYEVEAASPYDVLMDVYNTFISHYTTDSLGGTQFSNVEVDPSVFQAILDRYKLIPARNRYLPMSPAPASKAFVLLPSSRQIADLMRDSQYAEFQPFSEIVVAREGSTSFQRLNITVPRPVHFKVYVNNVAQAEITSLTEPYTAKADMGEGFECTPVQFTLADLKAGAVPPEVKIDLQKETVYCTLVPRPVVQVWTLVLEGDHPGYDHIKVRDRQSGVEIPVDAGGQFPLSGKQISGTLEVVGSDPSFVKTGLDAKDNVNKVLRARFEKRKPLATSRKAPAGLGSMAQNISFRISPTSFKDRRIDLHLEGGGKELVIPEVRVSNGEAMAAVPVGFFPSTFRVSAESEHYSTFDQQVTVVPEKEQDVVLRFSKKDFLSNPWVPKLFAGLAGLLVGMLIGWLCFGGVLAPKKADNSGTGANPPGRGVSNNPEPGLSDEEILKDVPLEMTFEELKKIFERSKDKEELAVIIEAYKTVLERIEKGDSFDNPDYLMNGKVGGKLSKRVRAALQATYKGCFDVDNDKPRDYDDKEKEEAKAMYEEHHKEFKSFKDLYHIGEVIKKLE